MGNGQHGRLDQVITDIDGEFKQHQRQWEHDGGASEFCHLDILHGRVKAHLLFLEF